MSFGLSDDDWHLSLNVRTPSAGTTIADTARTMNAILQSIVSSQHVSDATTVLPLRHPDFPDLPVAIDPDEGACLQSIIREIQPRSSVEIGCAYGISTLYICDALAGLAHPAKHIVIDPFQRSQWRGIGIKNLRNAGFESLVDLRSASRMP